MKDAKFVDWLSSGTEESLDQAEHARKNSAVATTDSDANTGEAGMPTDDTAAAQVGVNDFLRDQIKATHITMDNWRAAAKFCRYNPNELYLRGLLLLVG